MLRQQILEALAPLLGLPLSIARRAADMRTLQFGKLVDREGGCSVGEYALHIQCSWRIEGPAGIVTGRLDLYEPADQTAPIDWDTWQYDKNPNLQDKLFQEFFEQHQTALIVKTIDADECGGAVLEFENGYKLRLFPAGTESEDWRIFVPGDLDSHFLISGGKFQVQSYD